MSESSIRRASKTFMLTHTDYNEVNANNIITSKYYNILLTYHTAFHNIYTYLLHTYQKPSSHIYKVLLRN